MTRCPVVARDGRQCVYPRHEGKHLVAEPVIARDVALRIAHAWSWQGRMAESLVTNALSAGPLGRDRFLEMVVASPLDGFLGR